MKDKLIHISIPLLMPPRVALRPVRKTSVEFQELIESIKTDGILQSLLVRPLPNSKAYEIIEGEHRREAARIAGIEDAPCIVRAMSDEEALLIQLKANAIRPLETQNYEYARRLRKFLREGMRLNDLSNKIDKSPSWIKKVLKLNNLCEEAQKPVNYGDIGMQAAVALATLPLALQPRFIEDAKIMRAQAFSQRVRDARQDYEAFVLGQSQEEKAKGISPKVRSMDDIAIELNKFKAAKVVLKEAKAKTPMDGWKAALSWMLKIDPTSIHRRLNKIADTQRVILSDYDKRKLNRKIAETLVIDSLKPGDQTNGK